MGRTKDMRLVILLENLPLRCKFYVEDENGTCCIRLVDKFCASCRGDIRYCIITENQLDF